MECNLIELFSLFDAPGKLNDALPGDSENRDIVESDTSVNFTIISGMYSSAGVDLSSMPEQVRRMYELSIDAFKSVVHAWMSELPVRESVIRFGRKVFNAVDRSAAERAATDRGNPDVKIVMDISYKVWHEIDRMRGLLRFCPNDDGLYIAYCTPDYFVLPALAEHFTLRFGDTPWAIIDEKRGCCLCRMSGQAPVFGTIENQCIQSLNNTGQNDTSHLFSGKPDKPNSDEWEKLWQHYHKTINNESRNNPDLQRRLMPKRYWENLPEKL